MTTSEDILRTRNRRALGIAKTNGVTETELKEMIIHLAFYAGWQRAMSAIMVAKEVFAA
jgi:4-carboxymuconolactone decarboxylase